jgi:hypothetical protein
MDRERRTTTVARDAEVGWDYEDTQQRLVVETRQYGAREWHDRPESREPGWQVIPLEDAPGFILALRPTLRPLDG